MTTPRSKVSELYPFGIDYEWYASDASGQIAVFTSAGVGPIPIAVLTARTMADSFAEAVWEMPVRGHSTMLVSLPRPDDFIHFANCGFFAYDWSDIHRTRGFSRKYEMYSKPDNPIHLTDIPKQFQNFLHITNFGSLNFADSPTIDVRNAFDCEAD